MFERIKGSWELMKASGRVLLADKELIIFPVVSMIGAVIVTASFVVPAILGGIFSNIAAGEQGSRIVAAVLAFLFYVVLYTVIFYCNTALVGAALIRLRGGDPTVSDGFRIANEHLGAIFVYALISATVGMILRWVRERGILGRIAAGLFGLAWNVATYLVVPILVTENVSPVDAIKRSTALLKKTWGEQIVGNIGITAVSGLVIFLLILAGIPLLIVAAATNTLAIIASVALIWVLALVAVGLISSALNGIYTAAVYQYASSGTAGTYFDENQIRNAFRLK
ncbi:MAG TPA: DUF6159 family protein [Acidobacteriota bacterium]|nr:DUF6159 family protein [Acidobacteriota bacterium]